MELSAILTFLKPETYLESHILVAWPSSFISPWFPDTIWQPSLF